MPVYVMPNSVAFLNWSDQEFERKSSYSLTKAGYVMTERYETGGIRTTVWTKSPEKATGVSISAKAEVELIRLPVEAVASRLQGRLSALMPERSETEIGHIARSLALDMLNPNG